MKTWLCWVNGCFDSMKPLRFLILVFKIPFGILYVCLLCSQWWCCKTFFYNCYLWTVIACCIHLSKTSITSCSHFDLSLSILNCPFTNENFGLTFFGQIVAVLLCTFHVILIKLLKSTATHPGINLCFNKFTKINKVNNMTKYIR